MECLRTPRGVGAKGLYEDGERGVGELSVYKGMTLSCCDADSSISWLLVILTADRDLSIK